MYGSVEARKGFGAAAAPERRLVVDSWWMDQFEKREVRGGASHPPTHGDTSAQCTLDSRGLEGKTRLHV